MDTIRIATRESTLALWQANHVKSLLEDARVDLRVELVGITTEGDRRLDVALSSVGGKGLFIKELEVAIQEGRADLAVHSMKDVPATVPDGFVVTTIGDRADARDALVSNDGATFDSLAQGAKVGSSSLRRRSQLLHRRPDLDIAPVRGNVGTRLAKLDDGEYSALVLASAALDRLAMAERISQRFSPTDCVPAAGQGVLAVEHRSDRDDLVRMTAVLRDDDVQRRVEAERTLAKALGGDCTMPLGSHAVIDNGLIELTAILGAEDGSRVLRVVVRGEDPHELGAKGARQLLDLGAEELLDSNS